MTLPEEEEEADDAALVRDSINVCGVMRVSTCACRQSVLFAAVVRKPKRNPLPIFNSRPQLGCIIGVIVIIARSIALNSAADHE